MFISYKKSIFFSLVFIFNCHAMLNPFVSFADDLVISDVSQTSIIPVTAILKPTTEAALKEIIVNARLPISIAGGRYSQGGHIATAQGVVIDMTGLNSVLNLDLATKEITVQAGISWRSIQNYINPYNLSIKVMQSYNDFTIGGSLSVNVHGRDIHYGPLIETIKSIKVMLASGDIVTASRTENADLFSAVIGGYGALGLITQATISLTDNTKMRQEIKQMPIGAYKKFFFEVIKQDPNALLHNANLYPDEFDTIGSITWYKTDETLTNQTPLRPYHKMYASQMIGEQLLRRITPLKELRSSLEEFFLDSHTVEWRNYEMSRTANTLQPLLRFPTTSVLQEYFIPIDKLEPFIGHLKQYTDSYDINILNVSIRYVPQNNESILSYSRQESFALVLYINIINTEAGLEKAQTWTQKLIDAVLAQGGTYYLPYQLFGQSNQLKKAYPRVPEFIKIKKKYDPHNTFSNTFLEKYHLYS